MHVFQIKRGIIGDEHLFPACVTVPDPDLQIVFPAVGIRQRDLCPVADLAVIIAVTEVQRRLNHQCFRRQHGFLTGIHIHQDQLVFNVRFRIRIHAGQEGHALHRDGMGRFVIRSLFHALHELAGVSRRLDGAALSGSPVFITGRADARIRIAVIGRPGSTVKLADPQGQQAIFILQPVSSPAIFRFLDGIAVQFKPAGLIIGGIQRIMCIKPEDIDAFRQF